MPTKMPTHEIKIDAVYPDLKPCPFCGSTNVRRYSGLDGDNFETGCVRCFDCGASSRKMSTTWKNITDAWNRRAENV